MKIVWILLNVAMKGSHSMYSGAGYPDAKAAKPEPLNVGSDEDDTTRNVAIAGRIRRQIDVSKAARWAQDVGDEP